MKEKNVVVALDFNNEAQMYELVDKLDPNLCRLKVGKELFTQFGPAMVIALQSRGFDIFLDLKFHDIPNTVAKAVTAAADLGVWMVNVHASGGSKMIAAAKAALEPYGDKAPLLIAVTVLTSMSKDDLQELHLPEASVLVPRLAKLAADAGA
ncbi:MAG: orotidine-5'-phosphate decarboxylase, partial [Sinobacterium sp.]|nr:orotidine-5'-phosphate decarboxylase [Sinobacterium sp.]